MLRCFRLFKDFPLYDFDLRSMHVRPRLPVTFISVPFRFGFKLVRVRVPKNDKLTMMPAAYSSQLNFSSG
jgi:hypothetical protein